MVGADGCPKTPPVRSDWGYNRLPSPALTLPDRGTVGQSTYLSWPRCLHLYVGRIGGENTGKAPGTVPGKLSGHIRTIAAVITAVMSLPH